MGLGFLIMDCVARGFDLPDQPEVDDDSEAAVDDQSPAEELDAPADSEEKTVSDKEWTYAAMVQAEAAMHGRDLWGEYLERNLKEMMLLSPLRPLKQIRLRPIELLPIEFSGIQLATMDGLDFLPLPETKPQPTIYPANYKGWESFPPEFQNDFDKGLLPPLKTVAREILDEKIPGHKDMDAETYEAAYRKAYPDEEIGIWEEFTRKTNEKVASKGHYAGVPIPIEGNSLNLEPRHPYKRLQGARFYNSILSVPKERTPEQIAEAKKAEEDDPERLINHWWDSRHRRWTFIYKDASTGKTMLTWDYETTSPLTRFNMGLATVKATRVWSIEAEEMAHVKLKELVTPSQYKTYRLTGIFTEVSKKSGVEYIFRRLRPTVAIGTNGHIISILCLHPMGYYNRTWAGVMVPTDDVVAHLLMMRADEHHFWKKANHHNEFDAEAGL